LIARLREVGIPIVGPKDSELKSLGTADEHQQARNRKGWGIQRQWDMRKRGHAAQMTRKRVAKFPQFTSQLSGISKILDGSYSRTHHSYRC